MDQEQLLKFLRQAIGTMTTYTFPYIASVVGVIDGEKGEQVGTALRCVFNDRHAFVTANHVLQTATSSSYQAVGLSHGYGLPPIILDSNVIAEAKVDRSADLAVCFLPEDSLQQEENLSYWDQNLVDTNISRLATDYLFCHGFPGESSRFVNIHNGLFNKSLPYGAMQRLEELPDNFLPFEFALDYDPLNMKIIDDEVNNFIDPRGLSGSPVWRIGIRGVSPTEWSTEKCLLVGFLTRWSSSDRTLKATSVSRLIDLIETGGAV